MLKWTVQQKRQRASTIVDDTHEPEPATADCSSTGGGDISSRRGSDCCGEEQQQEQQQQQVTLTATPDDRQFPSGGPPTPGGIGPLYSTRCPPLEAEQTGAARVSRAAAAAAAGTVTAGPACDAEEPEEPAASATAFVRRASVRQPRARQARPLSLNLDTLSYGCDREAIPQKAKALLGIDQRPRTPIVAVVSSTGQMDRRTMSPKAMAVLGLTAAESHHAVEQQQQLSRQRLSQLRRRSPTSRQLQQISECWSDQAADGGYAAGGGTRGDWSGCSSSGSTSDGCGGQAAPAAAAASSRDFTPCNGDKGLERGASSSSSARASWHEEDPSAAVAAAGRTVPEHRCALSCGPSSGAAPRQLPLPPQAAEEGLNEAVEMVAARPKVARRRPLKHSRKEILAKSLSLAAAELVPRTAATELLAADDDGGGEARDCSSKSLARRCGSCTPDSGVGGLHGQAAEHDSPSDDDAVAAWQQPSPTASAHSSASYGSCFGRHSPLALPLRALCSPAGAHCDFIDVDMLLGAAAQPMPPSKPLAMAASVAAAAGSCRLLGSGGKSCARNDAQLTPDEDFRRRSPQQQQLHRAAGATSPAIGGGSTPAAGLRHAHSDPVNWASSAAAPAVAGDAVPCALERESMRWAAMRAHGGYHHHQLQAVGGRSGRSTAAQGHSAERRAALAAFRKTVHVYC